MKHSKILAVFIMIVLLAAGICIFHAMQPTDHGPNARVIRIHSYMRTLSTALEAYFIDNNSYPACAAGKLGANSAAPSGSPYHSMPTFRMKQDPLDPLKTLSTPVAYITSYFGDWYAPANCTFAYWSGVFVANDGQTTGSGWILWSAGPDRDFDIDDPAAVYSAFEPAPSDALIQLAYDPTNGSESSGDVYRVKQ